MISLSTLKALLDIEQTETAYDELLAEMEEQAVAHIERATGRYFRSVGEVTAVVRSDGGSMLWLPEPPVGDPTALAEIEYPGATETEMAVTTDYLVRRSSESPPREGWLERAGGNYWSNGYTYTVTYERGYAAGQEPGEVRRAVMDLVRLWFRSRGTAGVGSVRSETIGGYSYTLEGSGDESNPASVNDVIALWKRPVFA